MRAVLLPSIFNFVPPPSSFGRFYLIALPSTCFSRYLLTYFLRTLVKFILSTYSEVIIYDELSYYSYHVDVEEDFRVEEEIC